MDRLHASSGGSRTHGSIHTQSVDNKWEWLNVGVAVRESDLEFGSRFSYVIGSAVAVAALLWAGTTLVTKLRSPSCRTKSLVSDATCIVVNGTQAYNVA